MSHSTDAITWLSSLDPPSGYAGLAPCTTSTSSMNAAAFPLPYTFSFPPPPLSPYAFLLDHLQVVLWLGVLLLHLHAS